jgi:PAS domain S-box-containing protein
MRFVSSRGLSEAYRKAVEGHSPWNREDKNPCLIHIADIEASETPHLLKSVVKGEGIRALAFIPLVVNGRLIGKFMTYYDATHEFTNDELDLAVTVARQLGFAIEQKRTDHALRQRTRSLEIINRVGYTLSGELNLEKLAQAVTDAGREVCGAEFGMFVYNVKNEKSEPDLRYTWSGVPGQAFSKSPLTGTPGLLDATFKGSKIVRRDDVTQVLDSGQSVLDHCIFPQEVSVRSYLAVPVAARSGAVLGGLFFTHSMPGVFTEEDQHIIGAIAAQTSVALDNANLYSALERELVAHKDAEAERNRARESIARLAAIVEFSDDAIITLNLEGIIASWNKGAERLYGYSAEEAIGKPLSMLIIPPGQEEEETAILARLRQDQRIEPYQTVRRCKNGKVLDISLSVSPLRDTDGAIIGVSKIARDITQWKKTLQALRDSEQEFRTLADNISQLAWSASELGAVTWYNRRWCEFTGTTLEQMQGRGWESVHHPDHLERVKTKLQECLARGEPWEDTFPLRGKDGEYRWFLSRAIPIRTAEGKIESWFGTNTDITELREAREELARSNENLEKRVAERTASLSETMAQMEQFSYSVSHDLRAPVRAMQGYAQTLLEEYRQVLDQRGIEYLERIVRSGGRLERLTSALLTYSRIGRTQVTLQPVSLDALLADIISHYPEMLPPRAQISFETRLQSVLAHEPSLTQAISNLLHNAVKFVAPGVTPIVQVYSEKRGDRLRLWVKDNGIGIKPEHQGRLFGLFERIHTERQYEGTGIGLAVVRKAIERMGGQVGMESSAVGSKFWIELPIVESD